ncbi:hypothetical protein SULPSESMR1_03711 (plasmid) [Pseudosulfitobacter pseudonitzschiae]|uniref:Uncharacterized protein n=1 Tax=Pseudosulfitobacter pseudonitzschiae TaxID=1402135 RepID=A0A221K952_9RHOB|nr:MULTISPECIES: hypothetical protein [Roseobacteraceae]ASM75509.1 hypothetical protein SULPSESMR1_03711 [Pseudosulfitobacter pseudonitzschiae]
MSTSLIKNASNVDGTGQDMIDLVRININDVQIHHTRMQVSFEMRAELNLDRLTVMLRLITYRYVAAATASRSAPQHRSAQALNKHSSSQSVAEELDFFANFDGLLNPTLILLIRDNAVLLWQLTQAVSGHTALHLFHVIGYVRQFMRPVLLIFKVRAQFGDEVCL